MPDLYKIISSQSALTEFKRTYEQARKRGLGDELLLAAVRMRDRLEKEPLLAGEPIYHLSNLKLVVCAAVFSPMSVIFSIDEERRWVYLQRFRFCPRTIPDNE